MIRLHARIDDRDGDAAAVAATEHGLAIHRPERALALQADRVRRPANASLQAGRAGASSGLSPGTPAASGSPAIAGQERVEPGDRQVDVVRIGVRSWPIRSASRHRGSSARELPGDLPTSASTPSTVAAAVLGPGQASERIAQQPSRLALEVGRTGRRSRRHGDPCRDLEVGEVERVARRLGRATP